MDCQSQNCAKHIHNAQKKKNHRNKNQKPMGKNHVMWSAVKKKQIPDKSKDRSIGQNILKNLKYLVRD
jgi:hypothetical protein